MKGARNWHGSHRQYRRGAIMGLTIAEAFMLLVFALLLLFLLWRWDYARILEALGDTVTPGSPRFEDQLETLQEVSGIAEDQSLVVLMKELAEKPEFVPLTQEFTDLPPPQAQLFTDLVEELGPGTTLDLLDTLKNHSEQADMLKDPAAREMLDAIGELQEPQMSELREFASTGGLPEALANMRSAEQTRRLVRSDIDRKIAQAVSGLPDDEKRRLVDLVQSENLGRAFDELAELAALRESGVSLEEVHQALKNNDEISRKLADQMKERIDLADSIGERLGDMVAEFGGRLLPHGRIALPNDKLGFELGDDQINPRFVVELGKICTNFIETLHVSRDIIQEIRIEGHASSEWSESTTPEQAFLLNLDLSQRRAQNVLASCLQQISDPEIREWAGSRIVALGYSSSRPVQLANGTEDLQASRRVEFGYLMNDGKSLEAIQSVVDSGGISPPIGEISVQ